MIQKNPRKKISSLIEGVVHIIDSKKRNSKFHEIIYVGVCFKSTRSRFSIDNWLEEREKHEAITTNFKKFKITKSQWYNGGEIFVVPVKTFGATKIEIYLSEHALLGTGFEITLHCDKQVRTASFKNSEDISTSLGETVINWHIVKSENESAISFESNEETEELQQTKKPRTSTPTSN